jgi:hypothetical protein
LGKKKLGDWGELVGTWVKSGGFIANGFVFGFG